MLASLLRRVLRSNSSRKIHTVTFLRHGESSWNIEKRYTGWCDVPLSNNGVFDANDAGALMGERGMSFDVAFTSTLERAWRTCDIALNAAGISQVEIIKSWKLNERHYGALQGISKESPKLNDVFGEQQVIDWRRSYHSAPPSMYDPVFMSKMGLESLRDSMKFTNPSYLDQQQLDVLMGRRKSNDSPSEYPSTESLKDCEVRAYGYWNDVIAPRVKSGQRVLVVAHANTIRALVKSVDNIDDSLIAHLKIPNGIPLVYTLDDNLNPVDDCLSDDLGFQANYLVSARNHEKVRQGAWRFYLFDYYRLSVVLFTVLNHHNTPPTHPHQNKHHLTPFLTVVHSSGIHLPSHTGTHSFAHLLFRSLTHACTRSPTPSDIHFCSSR